MVSPMYARLELIDCATDFRKEADKKQDLAQSRYIKDNDLRACFAPIFRVGDYVFLDRPALFPLTLERSVFERYNKILP